MHAGQVVHHRSWIGVAVVAAVLVGMGFAPRQAAAGDLAQLDSSLKLVPADVAMYSAMLRGREQVEAVLDSRAWDKLKNMAVVQMGLGFYNLQAANPDSPVGQFQAALERPEVKEVLALVADMFSNEVFFYGDDTTVDTIEILQEMMGAVRYGPAMMRLSGENSFDEQEIQAAMALGVVADNADRLAVPNFVMGFKLSDTAAAEEQLQKLPDLLIPLADSDPRMQGRLKVETVAGRKYLVLSLDGEIVPWDRLPMERLEDAELEEGDAKKAVEALRNLKMVVALGIRDDYLLLSIGSSTEALAAFGAEGPHLCDNRQLQPLANYTDRRLTSIGFASAEMMTSIQTNAQDIDDLLEVLDELLPLAELDSAEEDQIRHDAAALAGDLKRYLPKYGATLAFSFMTDQGLEGYQYDWTEYPGLDGSKPLPLLSHVGGDPLLAVVGRGKSSPEDYDLVVKWAKTAYGYFDKFAVPRMNEREQREFRQAMDIVRPLLKRIDRINRELLIPALADGQIGFVLDAKLESKQYLESLPATEQPLPMLEPALVVGVSDVRLLKKAFAGYRKVLDDVVDAIRDAEPGAIPADYSIPHPEPVKTKAGTLWSFRLPDEWGVDEQIGPTLGVSAKVGVVTMTPDHAQRLLARSPLAVGREVIDPKRPLAGAMVFDFAGLIDAVIPWIDLAIDQGMRDNEFQAAMVKGQVGIVLDVLQVFRTAASESYFEHDALVTHSLMELRDVEPEQVEN